MNSHTPRWSFFYHGKTMQYFLFSCSIIVFLASSVFAENTSPSFRDTLNLYGGPDALEGKFEDAQGNPDTQNWVTIDNSLNGAGNFAQLWVNLPDADPDQDNQTPQWAFLDDGIIVPGVGPSTCTNGLYCYGPNELVTNSTGGQQGIYDRIRCSVVSPAMALPEDGGFPLLSFDAYMHNGPFPFDDFLFLVFGLEATSDPSGLTDWSFYSDNFAHASDEPEYCRKTTAFTEALLPEGMRWVRIRLDAHQMIIGPTNSTPAPYLDNVRLQWIPEAVSSVPSADYEIAAEAFPNPFNPTVKIAWAASAGSRAMVRVHDLTGRQVAILYDDIMPTSSGEVFWHGKNESGEPAAAGIYLCRIVVDKQSKILKLSLVK